MGKTKRVGATVNGADNDSAYTPSIFQSLFGGPSEHAASSTSVFSDSNPFRRKPSERTSQILGSAVTTEEPEKDGSENRAVAETKLGKRKKDGNVCLDPDSVEEGSENKKAKRKKEVSLDLGSQSNGRSGKAKVGFPGLDSESNGMSNSDAGKNPNLGSAFRKMGDLEVKKERKREKKRKRDEIEREYEEKHYGAAGLDAGEGKSGRPVVGEKRKTVDNAVDTLVPEEGFDDEGKLLRTVFVGNLPLKVKKKALLKEFNQFGEIESLRIRSVPLIDCKVPRKGAVLKKKFNDSIDSVHAYIVFKTGQSAQASLDHNMSLFGGNHIRVDRACPPRKKLKGENASLYDNRRTIFLGNLPFDVKDEEIYQLFCGVDQLGSSIEAVRVIRDPHTSVGKGIAYALFKTREAANLVMKKRRLKLRDRELRVTHARSSSTPSKRKHEGRGDTNDFPNKKGAVDGSSPQDGYERRKAKADLSYQGLRGCKSGNLQRTVQAVQVRSMATAEDRRPKERRDKRPAVAARKARQLALKNDGAPRIAGHKRKARQTPEGPRRGKKLRKSM